MRGVDGRFPSLARIAVATGPGSFTGIRVGLAMARAMGVALPVPVVGVSTLAASLRRLFSEPDGIIAATIDARHGSVYLQLFEASGRPLGRLVAIRSGSACVRSAPVRLVRRDAAALVAGEAPARRTALRPRRREMAPDIVALARMGLAVDPSTSPARPVYVKPPDACQMWPSRSSGRRPERQIETMIFGLSRSQPPVIRLLRPDRARACARLHAEGFAHPWSAEEMAHLIASSSTVGAVAPHRISDRLLGFVLVAIFADEAEDFDRSPRRRRVPRPGELGGRFSARICVRLQTREQRQCFSRWPKDNAPALALYDRFGFVKVGERAGYYRRADRTARHGSCDAQVAWVEREACLSLRPVPPASITDRSCLAKHRANHFLHLIDVFFSLPKPLCRPVPAP